MRIVSLVPSHTETLHALGVADQVVGRTRFCVHPAPWVDSVPVVGGTKDATAAKVLTQTPDLVVADKDENPKALVDELGAAGVEVLWSDIDDVGDAAAFVARLGAAVDQADAGSRIADAIRQALIDVTTERPVAAMPVFCPIWHDPWMTFDRTAYPHAMLDAAGFRNVFADHDGAKYFEVTGKEVQAAGAEAVLAPTEPFPFHKRLAKLDLSDLGALADAVHIIDGEALTWFGVRTIDGLGELARVRARLGA